MSFSGFEITNGILPLWEWIPQYLHNSDKAKLLASSFTCIFLFDHILPRVIPYYFAYPDGISWFVCLSGVIATSEGHPAIRSIRIYNLSFWPTVKDITSNKDIKFCLWLHIFQSTYQFCHFTILSILKHLKNKEKFPSDKFSK